MTQKLIVKIDFVKNPIMIDEREMPHWKVSRWTEIEYFLLLY